MTCERPKQPQIRRMKSLAGDLDPRKTRIELLSGFVAETDDEPIGFITVDQTGYVELAFVLPCATGRGVRRTLLNAAEQWARDNGATRLTTEASLVAHPFFLKHGWLVVEEEHVERKGVVLKRYKMRKDLA
jgi:putative acetyltransferase